MGKEPWLVTHCLSSFSFFFGMQINQLEFHDLIVPLHFFCLSVCQNIPASPSRLICFRWREGRKTRCPNFLPTIDPKPTHSFFVVVMSPAAQPAFICSSFLSSLSERGGGKRSRHRCLSSCLRALPLPPSFLSVIASWGPAEGRSRALFLKTLGRKSVGNSLSVSRWSAYVRTVCVA